MTLNKSESALYSVKKIARTPLTRRSIEEVKEASAMEFYEMAASSSDSGAAMPTSIIRSK